ncbi:MAG: hypothetical protein K0S09_39 [Sphingobacteriaceae bacterium]|jgi:hypothetical protein|nr:hypothetical protein [Sphingobacteriaceae bacterium]
MTPSEKARELIEKFKSITGLSERVCKECAHMLCDEMLAIDSILFYSPHQYAGYKQFWTAVKAAIDHIK